MKRTKVLALLLVALAIVFGSRSCSAKSPSFEQQAQSATGAMFNDAGSFYCSGTEIGHDAQGNGYFLTAHHCVADLDTNELTGHAYVSFSANEKGPFYDTRVFAISDTDDLAILRVINGSDIPEVNVLGDEYALKAGDAIFNSSFPLGMGKLLFHGEFMSPRFPKIDERFKRAGWPTVWDNSMPMNLTIAHGSSGSGVFDPKQHALIGVAVGTFGEGTFNIAIPASRIKLFLAHLQDSTVEKFVAAHPVVAASYVAIED